MKKLHNKSVSNKELPVKQSSTCKSIIVGKLPVSHSVYRKTESNYTSYVPTKKNSFVGYVISKKYTVSVHEHPLIHIKRDGWLCDGKKIVGGCKSGFTGSDQTRGELRFRCDGCDYDLCAQCLEAYLVN